MSVRTRINTVEVIYAPRTYEVNLASTIGRSFIEIPKAVILEPELIATRPLRNQESVVAA
jgi:hypothetical protein